MTHGWIYIASFFLKDNLGRFAAISFGPARGPFYYIPAYAFDFFPWSILSAVAGYYLWRSRKHLRQAYALSYGFPLFWCAVAFHFVFAIEEQAGILHRSDLSDDGRSDRGLDRTKPPCARQHRENPAFLSLDVGILHCRRRDLWNFYFPAGSPARHASGFADCCCIISRQPFCSLPRFCSPGRYCEENFTAASPDWRLRCGQCWCWPALSIFLQSSPTGR